MLNSERDGMAPRWERKVLHGLIQHIKEKEKENRKWRLVDITAKLACFFVPSFLTLPTNKTSR
jgi:predicted metal-dependent peptidase